MKGLLLTALTVSVFFLAGCPEIEQSRSGDILTPYDSAEQKNPETGTVPGGDEGPIRYYTRKTGGEDDYSYSETEEPFSVIDFGPVDELPPEIKKPSIYVLFSQPVVPLAKLGVPETASDIIEIDPPLKGVFRWYGTKLLSFDSAEDTLPQREYRVAVNRDTVSLGGKSLTGKNSFSFRTEYLSIRDVFPGSERVYYQGGDVPLKEAGIIHIIFSYPVDKDLIADYISVRCNGREYSFSVELPDPETPGLGKDEIQRTVRLAVHDAFPENSEVEIVLLKGARSREGYIGTPEDITKTFHTIRPFTFQDYDTYSWTFPRSEKGDANPVYLNFSHPVDEGSLEGALHTVPYMDVYSDMEIWNRTVKLSNLPVEPEEEYKIFLDASIKDIYGRELRHSMSVDISVPPARRYAYFPNTGTKMLEAAFPPKIVYEYQNVFDGVWKIGSIDDPYASWKSYELVPYSFQDKTRNIRHFDVIDLDPYLNRDGLGWVGVSWNFEEKDERGRRPDWGKTDLQVQVTDLAVTTRYAYNKLIAWVSSISTGLPVQGALVSVMNEQEVIASAETDTAGMALFLFEYDQYKTYFQDPDSSWRDTLRISAEYKSDAVEFKPNYSHNQWHFGIYNTASPLDMAEPRMEAFLFTDRGLYRPGEIVTYRGIDRTWKQGNYEPYTGSYTCSIQEGRYQGKILHETSGFTTSSGGFYGDFRLPEDLEPGYYQILYERGGRRRTIDFQVAYFTKLSFSVGITKPDITYYLGDSLIFTVQADYLAGGAVTKGTYEYYWTKEPSWFSPEGEEWESYQFGPDSWDQRYSLTSENGDMPEKGSFRAVQKTTSRGIPGMPYVYTLEALVQDPGYQQIAARKSAFVHPAAFYIGARLKEEDSGYSSCFIEKGKPFRVDFLFSDPEGNPVSKKYSDLPVTAELIRIDWKLVQQQGVYDYFASRYEKVETIEETKVCRKSADSGSLIFSTGKSGSYIVRLSAEDEKNRKAVTEISLYSTGSDWIQWDLGDSGDIDLVPDKEEYKPGDTARVLVKTPLPEGDYLLTIEREGIFEERVINLKGSAQVIEIPVREEYLPVVYLSLCSYTKRTGEPVHTYFEPDLDKPKGLFGIAELFVNPDSKNIELTMETDKESYRPGDKVTVTIKAERNGKPVRDAEITYLAADRGVLDLINYHVPDPLAFFYSPDKFPLGVLGADSRSLLMDPVTYSVRDLQGGDDEDLKGEGEAPPAGLDLQTRKDFRATAVFEPFLQTDKQGKVRFSFVLPDNLTTYRSTAVAVKDSSFGYKEGEVQARNLVNARLSMPKKLRVRDTAEALLVLTNIDTEDHTVDIKAETALVVLEGSRQHKVTVPAGSTETVPIRISATERGRGEISITLQSRVLNERIVQSIEVEKPLVFETFATLGSLTIPEGEDFAEQVEGVVIPGITDDTMGSLSVTIGPSSLSSLGQAVSYVTNYPFGCFEQRASKIMPLVLFSEYPEFIKTASQLEDPDSIIREELIFWSDFQRDDGSWPFWPRSDSGSSYYATVRIAHVLAAALEQGYSLPEKINPDKMLSFLRKKGGKTGISLYLQAYGLYVRSLWGDHVLSEALGLLKKGDSLGISGYALTGLALGKSGNLSGAARALETCKKFIRLGTRSVDITDTYETSGMYNSRAEQLSLLVMLNSMAGKDKELNLRLINSLIQIQQSGRWRTTAENNWAVQAFAAAENLKETKKPALSVQVTIKGEKLLSARFSDMNAPPSEQTSRFTSPLLSRLPRDKQLPLTFSAAGSGSLNYTAALTYALPSELIYPRDEGIEVFSQITDLQGDPVQSSALDAGKTYRVIGTVSSSRDRSYLAFRIPVPSGMEILDTSFVTTARSYTRETEFEGEPYYWYDLPGEKILDNEVRYFWDFFPKGRQEVEFLIRASGKGIFPTPPATAECMYEPEVFGRGEGRLVVIQ